MINTPSHRFGLKPITPTWAVEYLQNKPEFLTTRKMLIPGYIDAQTFCAAINKVRTDWREFKEKHMDHIQMIDNELFMLRKKKKEKTIAPQEVRRLKALSQEKDAMFTNMLKAMFNQEIGPRIRNSDIGYRAVFSLMGSLINGIRSSKEKMEEVVVRSNDELYDDLIMNAYEEEILLIMDDLIHQFFTEPELGDQPSEGERNDYGRQAWDIFIDHHKDEIEKGTIDMNKLRAHLHDKKVL